MPPSDIFQTTRAIAAVVDQVTAPARAITATINRITAPMRVVQACKLDRPQLRNPMEMR